MNEHLHLAGLFQRAILMAGSALSPWALNHQAAQLKGQVARQMECPIENQSVGADIGGCLRKKSLSQLLQVQPTACRFCPTFAPFVDGAVIAIDPLTAMQSDSDHFVRIPLVAGVTSVESYRVIRSVA